MSNQSFTLKQLFLFFLDGHIKETYIKWERNSSPWEQNAFKAEFDKKWVPIKESGGDSVPFLWGGYIITVHEYLKESGDVIHMGEDIDIGDHDWLWDYIDSEKVGYR